MSILHSISRHIAVALLATCCGLGGCTELTPATSDPTADLQSAKAAQKLAVILAVDLATSATSTDDWKTWAAAARSTDVQVVLLDLSNSRGRAAAIGFKATTPPQLIVTSPTGIILSRDDAPLSPQLVRNRVSGARAHAPAVDADYRGLTASAADGSPENLRRLADFLVAHKNHREAIPHLRALAANTELDAAARIAATVELCRSHLWVGEPEKSRQTAQALEAGLGATNPEATAAANLIFATQDIIARRPDRARAELQKAFAASPNSAYGREAAELLARQPSSSKTSTP